MSYKTTGVVWARDLEHQSQGCSKVQRRKRMRIALITWQEYWLYDSVISGGTIFETT